MTWVALQSLTLDLGLILVSGAALLHLEASLFKRPGTLRGASMDWAVMPRQQAFTLPLFNRPVGLALATPSLLAQVASVESSSVCLHPMFTSWALQEIIPELVLLDVSMDLFLMSKIFGCGRVLPYPDALCPASTADSVKLTLDDEHPAFKNLR